MQNGIWTDTHTFMPFSKPPSFLLSELATRESAPDYMAYMQFLPNPDPVLKKAGKDITVYRDLLSDSHIAAVESSRKAGVLSMDWEIDRGTAKSRHEKFVKDVVKGWDLNRMISEFLDANFFGYQVSEVLWKRAGDYIIPVDVVDKPQEWFGFGAKNELRRFTREAPLGVPVPDWHFLLSRHKPSYQNPYGRPLLALVFWWGAFKKGGIKWWVTFMEKYGMPFAVGKLPAGTAQPRQNDLLQKIQRMVQDAIAVIPDDASVEFLKNDAKTASADIYKGMADFCNAEISKAIIGHAGAADSTPGKLGGEDNALAVRADLVLQDKRLVERTMNTLIEWIIEINFGDAEAPKFCLYAEEEVDLTATERDKNLSATGVVFRKKHYQKDYGFEDDEFDVAAPAAPAPGLPPVKGVNNIIVPPADGAPPIPAAPAAPAQKAAYSVPIKRVLSPNALTLHFAKAQEESAFPDQTALDRALEDLSAGELQAFAEGMLKPIFHLIEKKASAEELSAALAEVYPKMEDAAFQQHLAQAIFVTELIAREHAQNE